VPEKVHSFDMSHFQRKLRFLASFAALSLLALTAGCHGFFVNPTLTALAVVPTSASLIQGKTQQITATGTYDDGSTKDLTGSANWTTSDATVATVSKGGLVTAASSIATPPGSATITATSGTLTATSAITVNTGPLLSIVISTTTPTPTAGQTLVFTAKGTFSGSSTQQDITSQVSWTSNNTAVISTITGGSGAVSSTATSGATTVVTATLNGITSGPLTITVQ
jgi:hypothetical protein